MPPMASSTCSCHTAIRSAQGWSWRASSTPAWPGSAHASRARVRCMAPSACWRSRRRLASPMRRQASRLRLPRSPARPSWLLNWARRAGKSLMSMKSSKGKDFIRPRLGAGVPSDWGGDDLAQRTMQKKGDWRQRCLSHFQMLKRLTFRKNRGELPSRLAHLQHQLAKVLAFEKHQQGFGEFVEAVDDVFAAFKRAFLHPLGDGGDALGVAGGVVEHHHAFHAGAV